MRSLILLLQRVGRSWNHISASSFQFLIGTYRVFFSVYVGGNCQFSPSCSVYAQECFKLHRPLTAFRLVFSRLIRCHPFTSFSYDPVPCNCARNDKSRKVI